MEVMIWFAEVLGMTLVGSVAVVAVGKLMVRWIDGV